MSSIFSIKNTVFVEFKNNVGYVESKDGLIYDNSTYNFNEILIIGMFPT